MSSAKYWPFCAGHHMLTHCGLVTPYGDRNSINIGSGNGLLPDSIKPLPEPMLSDHQWSPVTFILGQFHKRLPQPSITKIMSFKFLRGQWVNSFRSSDTIWHCRLGSILDLVMAFAWWHQAITWFSVGLSSISQGTFLSVFPVTKVFGNNIFQMPVTFPVAPFTLTWFDFNTSMDK